MSIFRMFTYRKFIDNLAKPLICDANTEESVAAPETESLTPAALLADDTNVIKGKTDETHM